MPARKPSKKPARPAKVTAASRVVAKSRRSTAGETGDGAPHTLLDALHRAIDGDLGTRLTRAAEALLDRAAGGEHWAIKELADRLDGRPNPATGERRRAVTVEVVRFAQGADENPPTE